MPMLSIGTLLLHGSRGAGLQTGRTILVLVLVTVLVLVLVVTVLVARMELMLMLVLMHAHGLSAVLVVVLEMMMRFGASLKKCRMSVIRTRWHWGLPFSMAQKSKVRCSSFCGCPSIGLLS
jgi:hypothetical protein